MNSGSTVAYKETRPKSKSTKRNQRKSIYYFYLCLSESYFSFLLSLVQYENKLFERFVPDD